MALPRSDYPTSVSRVVAIDRERMQPRRVTITFLLFLQSPVSVTLLLRRVLLLFLIVLV